MHLACISVIKSFLPVNVKIYANVIQSYLLFWLDRLWSAYVLNSVVELVSSIALRECLESCRAL